MNNDNGGALVTRIHVHAGIETNFAAWHARMSIVPGSFPGFIRTEVKAPSGPGENEWSVIQHFRSMDDMRAWQRSDAHQRLLNEIGELMGNNGFREVESAEFDSDSSVTEIIATSVKPGLEHSYREWAAKIHAVEAQFPGYRGGVLQPPVSEKQPYWTTLVRFATPSALDNWLNSAERGKLLGEHEELVRSWTMRRLPNSFAGWFPREDPEREPPTTLKQSLVVLLVLFPIVMAELRFLTPFLKHLPAAQATFVGNAISVGLIAWPLMPIARVFLNWWLSPRPGMASSLRAAGYALIAALYVAEIAILSNLA
jgi:antibiotic biosynthesis monooxygenase (ABM) superfamily enzyme